MRSPNKAVMRTHHSSGMLHGQSTTSDSAYCCPAAFAADSISVFCSSGVSSGVGSSGASATPGATLPPQPALDKTKRDSTDNNKNCFCIAEVFSRRKQTRRFSNRTSIEILIEKRRLVENPSVEAGDNRPPFPLAHGIRDTNSARQTRSLRTHQGRYRPPCFRGWPMCRDRYFR